MAVTSGVLAVLSFGLQAEAQEEAQEFREEQAGIQGSRQAEQRARQRRRITRERRIKQAQIEQAAINTGVAGGSGEASAIGTLATDFASNIGFLNREEQLSAQLTSSARRSGRRQTRLTIGAGIAGLGSQIAGSDIFKEQGDVLGAMNDIDDIFNDPDLF